MIKNLKLRAKAIKKINNTIYYLNENGILNKDSYKTHKYKVFYSRKYINRLLKAIDENKDDSLFSVFQEEHDKNRSIVYGESQRGRLLQAYVINDVKDYEKTVFITGVLHGFEGSYAHDGSKIEEALNETACYYSNITESLGKIRIVIASCCNPDGMIEGVSNVSYGRETYNRIDMNRDFIEGGFKAQETVYLAKLMDDFKPDIFIDIHGWLNALYGDKKIIEAFYNNCLIERKYFNQYGINKGYAISYTKEKFNAQSALIEFAHPREVCAKRITSAINEILEIHTKDSDINQNAKEIAKGYCDMIRSDKAVLKKVFRKN